MDDYISLTGAREHNLKDVTLDIPKNKIVVFTGVSGSGKSSLVFDTIYAESQRQLLETFSAFARRRLPKIDKPKLDGIRNISPAIKIDQKRMGENRRSTVGTATDISPYLRLLFSRCGTPSIGPSFYFSFNNPQGMCSACGGLGSQMVVNLDMILDKEKSLAEGALLHHQYYPGGYYFKSLRESKLFDMNKPVKDFSEEELHRLLYSDIVKIKAPEGYLLNNVTFEGVITGFRRRQVGKDDLQDRELKYYRIETCPECGGSRLNERARSVTINGRNIADLSSVELIELDQFLGTISDPVADPIVKPMRVRIKHLIDIGVGYISLDRPVSTLSGGESQRVKMARQLSCDLVNMIYVFDEPSIGLHPRDVTKLVAMLREIGSKGNSVLVVEHDPGVIEHADYVIELGPAAGSGGGHLTFNGTVDELKRSDALTGQYLAARTKQKYHRRKANGSIPIRNANLHNLKNVTVEIPSGVLTCITGVAGSGKSTLINDIFTREHPEIVIIDQSPVGRMSRSNPATYTGIFDQIRKVFAEANDTNSNLFSFNSEGACEKCNGLGTVDVEMHFLESVQMVCDKCHGKRYTPAVLAYKYNGKDISEVLEMTIDDAAGFFTDKKICHQLKKMQEVGLGYLTLGQPLSTLSGGEAQRIKLASELKKKGNIYVMDEPTTGLHMSDVERLMGIIHKLVNTGNTVVVIEHNLDVVAAADWVIDMGPEGGKRGGEIIAAGTPEDVARVECSYTGRYLRDIL